MKFEKDELTVKVLLRGPKRETEETAVIDTGATFSVIPPSMANFLGLRKIFRRQITLVTVSGVIKSHLAVLDVLLVAGKELHELEFAVHEIPDPAPIKVLLGMNFVKEVNLIIHGRKRSFHIE